MNRIKPIFISMAITAWGLFTYLLVREAISNGFSLLVFGLALVSLLPFGFFMMLMALKPTARTGKSLSVFTALIVAGVLLTSTEVYRNQITYMYYLVSIGSLALWLMYVYWYSVLPKSRAGFKIGDILPDLTFIDKDKAEISSTDFQGKKVLYMFYRGNWCPLCMAQIKEISAQYQELERRGVAVLLISPQPVRHSASLAKKMAVRFHFLTDTNNAMARKLRIDQAHGTPMGMEVFGYTSETVLPTVIITDEQGKIIFLDQTDNYRVRPEPKTFLRILDNH
jgi:peroxiredoxin